MISAPKPWITWLAEEDLNFVKRFVLASGSLKAVAAEYGISYPTVRLRLDRLIEKIKLYESTIITSDFERMIRALHADQRIDLATMKQILLQHQQELTAQAAAASQP